MSTRYVKVTLDSRLPAVLDTQTGRIAPFLFDDSAVWAVSVLDSGRLSTNNFSWNDPDE